MCGRGRDSYAVAVTADHGLLERFVNDDEATTWAT